MIKKLQKKLILITMAVIIAVAFVIVGGINITSVVKSKDQIQKVMNVIIEHDGEMPIPQINNNTPGEMNPNTNDFKSNDLSLETPFKTRYFTVLEDKDGFTFVNTTNIYSITHEDALEFYHYVSNINNTSGFYKMYRYEVADVERGTLYVFVNCEQELSNINSTLVTSTIFSFGSVLIIFILILFFSKIAVKPIAESYEKQKQFITDANHEIKTPLAIIKATNEIMELKFGENEWSQTINNQVNRLSSLTEKLVYLSKMDENRDDVKMENMSISSVIKEISEPYNQLAISQNKRLTINIKDDIEGLAEKKTLERLVSILLDNAFKYSDENGQIIISLSESGKHKCLSVYNTVDSINKGDLSMLFERFYRLDSSRNSSTGGSGIGLSIARAIASIYKGKISARSDDGKSIIIEFVF